MFLYCYDSAHGYEKGSILNTKPKKAMFDVCEVCSLSFIH